MKKVYDTVYCTKCTEGKDTTLCSKLIDSALFAVAPES